MISRTFLLAVAGIAGVFALGLLAIVAVQQHSPYRQQRVGGAFTMTEMNGRPVTDRDLLGKPTAIAFGFSYCPEVCPTTLYMLSQAMARMGREVERVNVVFVTVDPARDTAGQMKLYLSSFDPHIRGFTGTDAQVAGIANAYHVFYQRVPTEGGGYTMNHSAGVMLFDAHGELVGQIAYDDTPDQALAKLSTLVQPEACLPGAPPRVDLWSGAKLAGCSSWQGEGRTAMEPLESLALGRFVRDGAALLLWGGSVYLLLTPASLRAQLENRYARWRIAAIASLVAAVLALLPIQAAALGAGWCDAFDAGTVAALLSDTSTGMAWTIQGAAVAALAFARLLPDAWRIGAVATCSAALLASLTLTGHAAMHEGWLGLAHRANDLVHLLAGGFWFGALLPLLPTLGLLPDPAWQGEATVALRRFSRLGHGAVALVLATGIANVALILGRWPGAWSSPYERLLLAKILLVAAMTVLALVNRYALVPRLRDTPAPTIRRIRDATLVEVALGSGAIALVAIFGLLDPA